METQKINIRNVKFTREKMLNFSIKQVLNQCLKQKNKLSCNCIADLIDNAREIG